MKHSKTLFALTQAALALPGVAAAEVSADYLFADYEEARLPASDSASGQSSKRYSVQSHLLRIVAPLRDETLGVTLTYETMSGASPWFVMPGADGRPLQVMSGATIDEKRVDVQGTITLPTPVVGSALTLGVSKEDDYRSLHGGVELTHDNDDKTMTLTGGVSYSADKLEPTEGGSTRFPDRIRSADKDTVSAYVGVSRVLTQTTQAQIGFSYQHGDGFLSDPYKLVYVQSTATTYNESRPDGRNNYVVTARLRQAVPSLAAAIHADYRFYRDDWKVESHTVELSWQQSFGENWRVAPGLRWYSQSEAFFYSAYFPDFRHDGFASSDYRLSPFGALSATLDVSYKLRNWAFGVSGAYYDADARYAIKSVGVESPGLVEYWNVQLRVAHRFE